MTFRDFPASSSAKADDPVAIGASVQDGRRCLLGAPHSRGMTAQRLWPSDSERAMRSPDQPPDAERDGGGRVGIALHEVAERVVHGIRHPGPRRPRRRRRPRPGHRGPAGSLPPAASAPAFWSWRRRLRGQFLLPIFRRDSWRCRLRDFRPWGSLRRGDDGLLTFESALRFPKMELIEEPRVVGSPLHARGLHARGLISSNNHSRESAVTAPEESRKRFASEEKPHVPPS